MTVHCIMSCASASHGRYRWGWADSLRVPGLCTGLISLLLLAGPVGAQTNRPVTDTVAVEVGTQASRRTPDAVVIELSGVVEISQGGTNGWIRAARGASLQVGDQIRTAAHSRAGLQLTDRSVFRMDHSTTVRLRPTAQPGVLRRFSLEVGRLFFFNREKPSTIEFETPSTTGAIRGTEFLLSVPDAATTVLLLIEGAVDLTSEGRRLALESGDEAELRTGQPPRVSHSVIVDRQIQWALYYPAVLDVADLGLSTLESEELAPVLAAYQSGNLNQAIALAPTTASGPAGRLFLATLRLAAGQVGEAEEVLRVAGDTAAARAVRELIATVHHTGAPEATTTQPTTASEWLARSFRLQADSKLPAALEAAQQAQRLAPNFGLAAARVAELAFAEERLALARRSLSEARRLSPENPRVEALDGFILLEAARPTEALAALDRALQIDAGYGEAWLGRGLALQRLGRHADALAAFQAASALEPRRSLFRSYVAKAAGQQRDEPLAAKELRIARELDPRDPTPWLYSALNRHQNNDYNEAVRDLERSFDLNDQRSVFRSKLQLDRDRAVRSADLAAIYDAVGLTDVSERAASRAVDDDYSNFAGHLFVARSLQSREDPARFNLRYESPRASALLLANLLAPAGGGNLSQQLSQQDHLRFFDSPAIALSSLTLWNGNGDWGQGASVFGTLGGLGYAIDAQYQSLNGWRPNQDSERLQVGIIAKQQITAEDSLYLQVGSSRQRAGDAAYYWDPANANLSLRVKQDQLPFVHAGWSHRWAPGSQTLLLASYYDDELELSDPSRPVPFLRQTGGVVTVVDTQRAVYNLDLQSKYRLGSVELQQIWQSSIHTVVAGGRYQHGEVDTMAQLSGPLPPPLWDQSVDSPMDRVSGYAYYQIEPWDWLRLNAGGSYETLRSPSNPDLPPLNAQTERESLLSPKLGLTLRPFERTTLQAAWSRSLGGLYFDNSVRLEPTRLAGFNQSFRSLVSESIAGIVPGTEFEVIGARLDHSIASGTYVGVSGERLTSTGDRDVGAVSNSLPFPFPDTPTSTRQAIDFEERSLGLYANQLLGRFWALGTRYQVSEAELANYFPLIPRNALGLASVETDQRATLHQVQLFAVFNHTTGWFARWESDWYSQNNSGYQVSPGDEDIWMHEALIGYRFPRRRAEIRAGVVNIFDTDHRLNPLNLQAELARQRTVFLSLRLNF